MRKVFSAVFESVPQFIMSFARHACNSRKLRELHAFEPLVSLIHAVLNEFALSMPPEKARAGGKLAFAAAAESSYVWRHDCATIGAEPPGSGKDSAAIEKDWNGGDIAGGGERERGVLAGKGR